MNPKKSQSDQKFMHEKKFFKKTQNFEFFQKTGPRGQKIKNFRKKCQNQKGLQKLDIKPVPQSPKENFKKSFLSPPLTGGVPPFSKTGPRCKKK